MQKTPTYILLLLTFRRVFFFVFCTKKYTFILVNYLNVFFIY